MHELTVSRVTTISEAARRLVISPLGFRQNAGRYGVIGPELAWKKVN
jgi:hypothetical protein